MSTINEQRNVLLKRFKNKAVITIDDTLYSSHLLLPNDRNHRLFPVHDEAVQRLNSTMQRHIDGNAQIYYTMIFKDQPRQDIIKEFWNGLITTPEFKSLPSKLQELELEQAKKLAPTSRFTCEKLFEGFVTHVDDEAKTKNSNISQYQEAAEHFTRHIINMCKKAVKKDPSLIKYIDQLCEGIYELDTNPSVLPTDKAGGDPYFIRVDKNVAGTEANELYLRDSKRIPRNADKSVYYTLYSRVQNKGNNIVKGIEQIREIPEDCWLPEKNRVVQGDSRSWQFLLKPYSDIITKLPKTVDPLFMGWRNQEEKNEVMKNTLKEFRGKVNFDSFDATEYDASTDPENFALGIRIILNVCNAMQRLSKWTFRPLDPEMVINHYLKDPTLTPWGAFLRNSTPSGHNFTGPNGTIVNLLRCYVQEARRRKVSYETLNRILGEYADRNIALFSCVGDDAFQLRNLDRTPESIAEENFNDGFTSNADKILLDPDYIHYLQFAYYWDGKSILLGFYPISRVMEHALFQEHADQYTAETVSTLAIDQNLNNARYNPLLPYGVKFLMGGDVKYRLGFIGGVMNLFKAASQGKSVAEFLGREWDPTYSDMSWDKYSESMKPLIDLIETTGRKYF